MRGESGVYCETAVCLLLLNKVSRSSEGGASSIIMSTWNTIILGHLVYCGFNYTKPLPVLMKCSFYRHNQRSSKSII